MLSHITTARGRLPRLRRAVAALALATLPAAACKSPEEILAVTDPDIIFPEATRSAAGASAARLGALARLNVATSGAESMFHYGGLMADEWRSGDTFIQRDETDKRAVQPINANVTTANRNLHRARLTAELAVQLLTEFTPTATTSIAEMYLVQAYTENVLAEHFCSGIPFSTVVDGVEQYGTQLTTVVTLERALAHADSGLAIITGTAAADVNVLRALRVTKARILLNLDRPADASTAIGGTSAATGVPTDYRYQMQHSQTSRDNAIWSLNNSARRYTVSAGEGGVGINFATANDPRVPACAGGSAACRAAGVTQSRVFDSGSTITLHVQLIWPTRESPVTIISGVEARLIEAEAQLRAGNAAGALATLNQLRTTVAGLGPLTLAATPDAQVDQLFRERAFWLFSRGHRLGDLRRLVRPSANPAAGQPTGYGRTVGSVFPTGAFHKGGSYGTDVNFPNPQAEENNPNVPVGQTCFDRNA
jgi:hypothetical protein